MVTFSMPGRCRGLSSPPLPSAPAAERTAMRRRLHLASLPLSLLPYLFPSLPRFPLPLPSSSFPPCAAGEAVAGLQPGGAGRGRGIHLHRPPPASLRPLHPRRARRRLRARSQRPPGPARGGGSAASSAGAGHGPGGDREPRGRRTRIPIAGGAGGMRTRSRVGAGLPCRSALPAPEREFRNSAVDLARRVWGLRLNKANSSGKERD